MKCELISKLFYQHLSCFLVALVIGNFSVYSQNECAHKIDSFQILSNENLPSFIDSITAINFESKKKKKHIPKVVLSNLDCWTNQFSIANAGIKIGAPDTYTRRRIGGAERQIVFFGISQNYLILSYRFIGNNSVFNLMLIQFNLSGISDFWVGSFIGEPAKSKQEVLYYLREMQDNSHFNGLNL